MSLKTKVALITITIFILYALADYAVQHFIIYPEFVALEQDEGKKNMDRVLRAIANEMHHLDKLCFDWAAWDDTYKFVNSPTDEYIEANLPLSTFVDSNIHLICFLDANGKRVWSEVHNLETGALIRLPYFEKEYCRSSKLLTPFQTEGKPFANVKINGFFMTVKGPMMIASRPVLTSNNEGPIRGAVIMGSFLNDKIVKNLTEQTLMQFRLFPLSAESKQQHLQAVCKRITDKNPYFVDYNSDQTYSPGTLFPWVPPEPRYSYADTIEARARWDIEGLEVPACDVCPKKVEQPVSLEEIVQDTLLDTLPNKK